MKEAREIAYETVRKWGDDVIVSGAMYYDTVSRVGRVIYLTRICKVKGVETCKRHILNKDGTISTKYEIIKHYSMNKKGFITVRD